MLLFFFRSYSRSTFGFLFTRQWRKKLMRNNNDFQILTEFSLNERQRCLISCQLSPSSNRSRRTDRNENGDPQISRSWFLFCVFKIAGLVAWVGMWMFGVCVAVRLWNKWICVCVCVCSMNGFVLAVRFANIFALFAAKAEQKQNSNYRKRRKKEHWALVSCLVWFFASSAHFWQYSKKVFPHIIYCE